MTQRVYSLESEEAVLGAVMVDGSCLTKCNLAAEDFFRPMHQSIWRAINQLNVSRETIDPVSLTEQLERDDVPAPKKGWLEALVHMVQQTASTANVETYANTVRQYSIQRRAISIGKQLVDLQNIEEVDRHIRDLINLTASRKSYSCSLAEAMSSVIDLIDSSTNRISTGFKDIDSAMGGFFEDDLIVVAGRPAMGKTAFMLNLALSSSKPTGIITGEQGRDQVGMRCIAIDQEVSLHHMRTGNLGDDEWFRINQAIGAAKSKSIYLYDKPAPTIEEVIQRARQWKYENDIGILMIDYLQKLRGGEGREFRLQIGDITSRLKNLARDMKIPIILLAQISRDIEKRPMGSDFLGRMPYPADLAESAIIENEADVIMTLYRPEVYVDVPQLKGMAYVNTCKNRHGPTGYQAVSWRGEYLKFGDLAAFEPDFETTAAEKPTTDKWNYTPG